MIEISLDIETFARSPSASIASIGAIAFSLENDWTEPFYRVVHDSTGVMSPQTIRWHAEHSGDTLGLNTDAISLEDAMREFTKFLMTNHAHIEDECRIWSHATFDIPVLDSANQRIHGIGSPQAWHYRNPRDLRTLYDLSGGRPSLERVGTSHNALDDAIYQMNEVRACFAALSRWVLPDESLERRV